MQVSAGSTVQQILDTAGISLQPLDRVEPSLTSAITQETAVSITRVSEEFVVQQSTLPFETQTVKNESIPEGQKILIQPGMNGQVATTYRIVKENGKEVSRSAVKTETIVNAKPEILMIGVQSPFVPQPIVGRLAYITASNAWLMEGSTGNRRPLVTTGDLDGRIFVISPDRNWLLFSRLSPASSGKASINSLWIINLQDSGAKAISLGIENVVHFADWIPGTNLTIAYSTVEPRDTPPGWQANNDLVVAEFDNEGKLIKQNTIVEPNNGGIYGWWGTSFSYSPDGTSIAYARPDSIGLVNAETGQLDPLVNLIPYQTGGDWAWVPGLSWSPDGQTLYGIVHGAATDSISNETSPEFDLSAFVLSSRTLIRLVPNSGMFSYPRTSPLDSHNRFQLALLTSILPDQSGTSKYELRVMDRDGSNGRKLYPGEGIQGLGPQQVIWSPDSAVSGNILLGFLAQGNIMFVDVTTGTLSQVTGDGSVNKMDWK